MNITKLVLNNFRCFENRIIDFQSSFVVIQGDNGSGKTSILEALYYGCYLRSFRTTNSSDLLNNTVEEKLFFIGIDFINNQTEFTEKIQIGYARAGKKTVKLDDKPLQTYKDLIAHYRVVSLTTDDIALVQGAPELRRDFLNYSLVFQNSAFLATLKTYRRVLAQRNALLQAGLAHGSDFEIWTQQLFELSTVIQTMRKTYLTMLETRINNLIQRFLPSMQNVSVTLEYCPKVIRFNESYDAFIKRFTLNHKEQELTWRRTLFGAHLDDFIISFQEKKARIYASRGQQKLVTLLIKIAQLHDIIATESGAIPVFLIDDYLTDFDLQRGQDCLAMIMDLPIQIFLTIPTTLPKSWLDTLSNKDFFLLELE